MATFEHFESKNEAKEAIITACLITGCGFNSQNFQGNNKLGSDYFIFVFIAAITNLIKFRLQFIFKFILNLFYISVWIVINIERKNVCIIINCINMNIWHACRIDWD